jgi:hypothetical protein
VQEPDDLTLTIAQHLEVDSQYVEHVEAWDTERIAEARSAGRKAGRLLGWKIVTHQAKPDDQNRVVVIVMIRGWPDEDMRERLSERGRLLMDKLWPEVIRPSKPSE